jgi:hypothetical protein
MATGTLFQEQDRMAILAAWDNKDQTVLRIDLEGQWNWKEYDAAIDHAWSMIREAGYTIDVIINITDHTTFPPVQSQRHFLRMLTAMPPNLGLMIAAGGDPFISGLLASFLGTRLADSLPQARAMLTNRARLGTLPSAYSDPTAAR